MSWLPLTEVMGTVPRMVEGLIAARPGSVVLRVAQGGHGLVQAAVLILPVNVWASWVVQGTSRFLNDMERAPFLKQRLRAVAKGLAPRYGAAGFRTVLDVRASLPVLTEEGVSDILQRKMRDWGGSSPYFRACVGAMIVSPAVNPEEQELRIVPAGRDAELDEELLMQLAVQERWGRAAGVPEAPVQNDGLEELVRAASAEHWGRR